MRLFKSVILLLSLAYLLSAVPVMAVTPTTDDHLFSACKTNSLTANSAICKAKGTTTNPVNKRIKIAADIVAIATGVAAVISIILAGVTMVTSAGNAEAVANARKTITYAVVGLVVVALAWTIISFVTDRLIK